MFRTPKAVIGIIHFGALPGTSPIRTMPRMLEDKSVAEYVLQFVRQ
jgi:predicted TIM-barrel enzyme